VADREAEARPHARRLGGEEGVEEPREHLGRDARPRVAHGDADEPRLLAGGDADEVVVGAAFGEGLGGVHEEVDEHLGEAVGVGEDAGDGRERALDAGPQAELVADEVERGLDHGVDVDRADVVAGAAGEGAEVADDGLDAPGPVAKALGSSFGYSEEGTFDKKTRTFRFKMKTTTMTDKLRNEGTVRVEPLGDNRCRRVVEIVAEAKVFGIGGLIEGSLEKSFRTGWGRSAEYIVTWARQKGLT
jgi:hypothetical protein